MKKYVIIDAEAIQKRIEGLEKDINNALTNEQKMLWTHELNVLRILLSQSTPLIPEIEKAFDEGFNSEEEVYKGYPTGKIIGKEDYIANLKLDI